MSHAASDEVTSFQMDGQEPRMSPASVHNLNAQAEPAVDDSDPWSSLQHQYGLRAAVQAEPEPPRPAVQAAAGGRGNMLVLEDDEDDLGFASAPRG